MPFISMRELLRNPNRVFNEIDEKNEPFVVTRRGQPIAALVPVAPSQLQNVVLGAAPELLESRRDAETAGAEGRTKPLGDLVQQLDAEDGDDAEASSIPREELTRDLVEVLGSPLAEEVSAQAEVRIA